MILFFSDIDSMWSGMMGRLIVWLPSRQCLPESLQTLMKYDFGKADCSNSRWMHSPCTLLPTHKYIILSCKTMFCFTNCVRCSFYKVNILSVWNSLWLKKKNQLAIYWHNVKQQVSFIFFFAEIFIQIPNSILFFKNQLNPNKLPVRPYATDLIAQKTCTTIRFLFQTDNYVKILLELTSWLKLQWAKTTLVIVFTCSTNLGQNEH